MKNRLVGLDQHHIDLLMACEHYMFVEKEYFMDRLGKPRWTWFDDYMNDMIRRGFITVSPSGHHYALTVDGRKLWNLSAQYNDERDDETLANVERSMERIEDGGENIS